MGNLIISYMQDKQKVTLYMPPGIHRQLRIRSAIDAESMSAIVERAIDFYIKHPDKVEAEEKSAYGKTNKVHICPECDAAMVMREGQMMSLKDQPSVLSDESSLPLVDDSPLPADSDEEKLLVPC